MKTLLLSLSVLAMLVSCGKNNTDTAPVAAATSVANPLITGSTQAQTLVSAIANPTSFGQGLYYVNSNSSQNCGTTFFGLLSYCTTGYSGSSSSAVSWNQYIASNPSLTYRYTNGTTVRHADVAMATKQAQLNAILESATAIQVSGYNVYTVKTATNTYVIDMALPLQVNPVVVYSLYGELYRFSSVL